MLIIYEFIKCIILKSSRLEILKIIISDKNYMFFLKL